MYVQLTEDLSSSTACKTLRPMLASQLVVSALLDEFANIDNIYESYKPTIKLAVWLLKTDAEN